MTRDPSDYFRSEEPAAALDGVRHHRTLNKEGRRSGLDSETKQHTARALGFPNGFAILMAGVICCPVWRKRRGPRGRKFLDSRAPVAGMPQSSPFFTDFPTGGTVDAKTVCHLRCGW
jgi:hypothetical protein